ncbi:MAG: hypothetical protein M1510_11595 [Nitrospirae bacterium]|nr:hypothetical protein [Nitrospirota bacterium]
MSKEKQMAQLAAEIAEKINEAEDKGEGNPETILDMVVAMVAPGWRIVDGRS